MDSLSRWRDWKPFSGAFPDVQPAAKPTKPAEPETVPESNDVGGAAKPSKPTKPGSEDEMTTPAHPGFAGFEGFAEKQKEEIEYWLRLFGGTVAQRHPHPAPTALSPVHLVIGGCQESLTFARHNRTGMNRFGQSATDYPYCVLNFRAWQQNPFDLSNVRWYASRDEAMGGSTACAMPENPEDNRTSTMFSGGIQVELRLQGTRWVMWIDGQRRKDFASPSLNHSRYVAERWFGAPVGGWREPASNKKESE